MAGEGKFGTSEGRWSGFGPYYGMFPLRFAVDIIDTYSSEGDVVLDPFSGRGTSLFAASSLGRPAVGVEINPVGWIYSSVKTNPAPVGYVLSRLHEISERAKNTKIAVCENESLDEFLSLCFSPRVRVFLEYAQAHLDWRNNEVDRTLMGFILLYLHGKEGSALSNRMSQSKSMAMKYSVDWWRSRGYAPPDIDPEAFLSQRIKWRYSKGVPELSPVLSVLGDSTEELAKPHVTKWVKGGATLLLTSPPYAGVTDYHADQWIRLWSLGIPFSGPCDKTHRGRFNNRDLYRDLLEKVFAGSKYLLSSDACLCVRSGTNPDTLNPIRETLLKTFPEKRLQIHESPCAPSKQTRAMGNKSKNPGEVDLIMTP